MSPRSHAFAFAFALAYLGARGARAGGYEIPDVGSEALGRGAAFTAKADDGTAFTYNVAGFAAQRGARATADGSFTFGSYAFTRAGAYPDGPTDPRTPWGARPFPTARDTSPPTFAPYLVLSSDFGTDRWTFAAGVFTPAGSSERVFPINVEGAPSPARYDVIQSQTVVLYPSVAAAYRLADDLDVGLALHGVYGDFEVLAASTNDFGPSTCPTREFRGCDSDSRLSASGFTGAASAGALWRATRNVSLGLNLRSPWSMRAQGDVVTAPPPSMPDPVPNTKAALETAFPFVARVGARVAHRDGDFEVADVEVNATYEAWSAVEGKGPLVDIPAVQIAGAPRRILTTSLHGWGDTFSVRLGGAYNLRPAPSAIFTLRAGAFYDTSPSSPLYTRVDVDTLAKTGLTLGAGIKSGFFAFNVAYAEIFETSRLVEAGTYRPMNGLQGDAPVDASGRALEPVNAGQHEGHTRMLSFGVRLVFDRSK